MRLVRRKGKFVEIAELGIYRSKSEFNKIIKKFDSDPISDKLFAEFLSVVHKKKFWEEEFETM